MSMLNDFKNNLNTISGVYMFYSSDCKVCMKQKELFEKAGLKNYQLIDCVEDINFFIEHLNIDILPETRIYENGKVVWSKIDLVSNDDVKFLQDYLNV